MKALILAATPGQYLDPITATRPKSMIPAAGKPLLEYHVSACKQHGISDIEMVIGHCGNEVVNYFGKGRDFDVNIHYTKQEEQIGIGDAILQARDRFSPGDYFILIYADHLTAVNSLTKTLSVFRSFHSPVASVTSTMNTEAFGNVYLGTDTEIIKIIEKPKDAELGNYVLAGIFVLPTAFFDLLEKNDKNMILSLHELISTDKLYASIWSEKWLDVAYPWNILQANQMAMDELKEGRLAANLSLEGHVKITGPVIIEPNVVIKSGSVIRGPSYIGQESFIGNNVLVREYTAIGPKSTIGYGVELKNCLLLGESKVGRLSFIGDSVIGRGVNIGSGVMTVNQTLDGSPVVLNLENRNLESNLDKLGAFIGDNVMIGASNTLAPGSLIPARVIIPHNISIPTER